MEIATTGQAKELIEESKYLLIDFFATWCGPCKLISPILSEIDEEVGDLKVIKIDADLDADLAILYGVTALPTCLLFVDGQLVDRFGLIPKASMMARIKAYIS